MTNWVNGYCPHGCGETLMLEESNVECCNKDCPEPLAVTTILAEPVDWLTAHVVHVLDDKTWNMRHPLWERQGDALLSCTAALDVSGMLEVADVKPGESYEFVPGMHWRKIEK